MGHLLKMDDLGFRCLFLLGAELTGRSMPVGNMRHHSKFDQSRHIPSFFVTLR